MIRDDPAINAGSLMLLEPGASDTGSIYAPTPVLATGAAPTNGQVLYNRAWREFCVLAGISAANALANAHPSWTIGGGWVTGTTGKMERTPQGSIHGIVSQTVDTTTSSVYLTPPAALATYLYANTAIGSSPKNKIALSLWQRTTRVSPGGSFADALPMSGMYFSSGALVQLTQTLNDAPYADSGGGGTGGTTVGSINATGAETFRCQDGLGWGGSAPGSAGAINSYLANWGLPQGLQFSSYLHVAQSWVFRRFHLVDLTAAGLTYAQFEAMEQNEWLKATAAAGTTVGAYSPGGVLLGTYALAQDGRYHGDTVPTAPSTIP